MKEILKYKFGTAFTVIFFVSVFGLGIYVGMTFFTPEQYLLEDLDLTFLWEGWSVIENKYINYDSIDHDKIMRGAVAGMIRALDDPPTVFFEPEESKRFLDDTMGSFEGIGIEIGIRNGQLKVITPLQGTPAEKAGLRAGDKILGIDGELTIDMRIEEAVSLIRGEKGTEVVLTIFREGWDMGRDIPIIRGVIEIPSLEWEMINDIAHIRLIHFSGRISSDFSKVAREVLNSPARAIILDLRNNPGGSLNQTIDISNWFLKKDDVVLIQQGREDRTSQKARGDGHLSIYPMVILINQGSASASEILAAAIRDNLNVTIVGENSFGKGSVQELVSMSDGSAIKVTIAKWLTPKGDLIEGKGITPDIVIEMTEEDYEEERDPQPEKAIEILTEIR